MLQLAILADGWTRTNDWVRYSVARAIAHARLHARTLASPVRATRRNYGHFMVYAPADKGEARDYGVARYGMEVQRLLSVLDRHLEGRQFMVGESYTIADMACFPWVQTLRGKGYDRPGQPRTVEFLGVAKYTNVLRWADMIMERPATYRGVHQSYAANPRS